MNLKKKKKRNTTGGAESKVCRPDGQPVHTEAAAEVQRGRTRCRGLDLRGCPDAKLGLHGDTHTKAGCEVTM